MGLTTQFPHRRNMAANKSRVVEEVIDGNVVRVKIEVNDADEIIEASDDQILVNLQDAPTYEDYRANLRDSIEKFATFIGQDYDLEEKLEREWSRVYDRAATRGQIVLRALYERGEDVDEGIRVDYDDVEAALEEEDYKIKGKTMPGIYRGINTKIRDYISGVESRSDAKSILKRVWDEDDNKCRLLVNIDDGPQHAEAFKAAMSSKDFES